MNLQEQIAYIEQRQEEVQRFSAEMRAASAKERTLWIYPISGMIAGAACVAVGMVFAKLLSV